MQLKFKPVPKSCGRGEVRNYKVAMRPLKMKRIPFLVIQTDQKRLCLPWKKKCYWGFLCVFNKFQLFLHSGSGSDSTFQHKFLKCAPLDIGEKNVQTMCMQDPDPVLFDRSKTSKNHPVPQHLFLAWHFSRHDHNLVRLAKEEENIVFLFEEKQDKCATVLYQ